MPTDNTGKLNHEVCIVQRVRVALVFGYGGSKGGTAIFAT